LAVDVSVVVPVRDGARTIGACLDALAAQAGSPTYEVVVVDNGSTDATASIVRAHPLGARLVSEPVVGSYSARNAGVAAATGRVLAFTDADCRPRPDWLAAGARVLADAAIVGGRIDVPLPPNPSVWARYDRAVYLDQQDYVRAQGFAATANLFVAAAVFTGIGSFDPALASSGDLEFCRRATGAGHRLGYANDAVVDHTPRATALETWRLHRRLGAGWATLARRGQRPKPWRDRALRLDLGTIAAATEGDRRRALVMAHAVAMAARWTGRLSGRA
jgi:glycosyltransferase involved in cell wall biosynthesis